MDFLSTRDDEAFDNFRTALERNDDKEVANMLREAAENASQGQYHYLFLGVKHAYSHDVGF